MNCRDIAELAPLYFSGELESARQSAFGQHLAHCGVCAEQVEEERRVDARLHEALMAEPVDSAPVEARVRELIASGQATSAQPRNSWWLLAAAAVLLLVALSASYRAFLGARVPQVYADAADDHQDEVVAQQPRPWHYDRSEIVALAERHQIPAQDLTALERAGYRLERAKICRLDDQAYLHLVYASAGQQFSLFLRRADGRQLVGRARAKVDGKRIFTADSGPAHVAAFQDESVTAFLVTDEPGDAALRVAGLAARGL